jgi:hypothetical protein
METLLEAARAIETLAARCGARPSFEAEGGGDKTVDGWMG